MSIVVSAIICVVYASFIAFLVKRNYLGVASLITIFIMLIFTTFTSIKSNNDIEHKFKDISQYIDSGVTDEINGATILGFDYETNKLTLKSTSGEIKEYILSHYPVEVTNPESVDKEISSALYAYLWSSKVSSPATILDWDDSNKFLTYKLENSNSNQVIKLGVETFYKPTEQKQQGSSGNSTNIIRDAMIGYTFYKAVTGGFK